MVPEDEGMNTTLKIAAPVQRLLDRGVVFPNPFSVEIDASVDPDRIAPGVIIHTGCRISGVETSIGPGCELGKEAPVAIENCQLGHGVHLGGGYFSGATFLDGVAIGSAAHVRPGTLLEEGAGAGHAVGFKQTIFLPFVKAGSLINFCDVLMAGGTGPADHSEIGSSYIHFNFTPHQDKATASLVGDVPHGVFLDQPPIFLGGQGGLVGPARIAFGTVIPAGTICRQDILQTNLLFPATVASGEPRPFAAGIYRAIDRIVTNNLIYIGNLWALKAWYQCVRIRTMSRSVFHKACYAGAVKRIEEGLTERIKRLRELAGKMPFSLECARQKIGKDLAPEIRAQQQALVDRWPEIEARLKAGPAANIGHAHRTAFLQAWEQIDTALDHVAAVRALPDSVRKAGRAWLQEIVNSAAELWSSN